jgi:hypothetical protein
MNQFSEGLTKKLNSLNQRMLKKGEVFLLAKAIADSLPLMPPDEGNVKLFIITHRRLIDEVIWGLNSYSHLSDDDNATLLKLIGDLTLWRASVAYNPPVTYFRDCPNSVIDDISNLPRYVDITHMCAVGDMINDANYMSDLFRTIVAETKADMINNGGSSDQAVATPIAG